MYILDVCVLYICMCTRVHFVRGAWGVCMHAFIHVCIYVFDPS